MTIVGNEPTIPAGMKRWYGGDSAPADWDGGPVLWKNGALVTPSSEWSFSSQVNGGVLTIAAYTPRAPGEALPTDRMWVRWSTDGEHMRKWAREPFDGAVEFVRPSARDGECERLREAYRVGFRDGEHGDYNPDTFLARAALSADRSDPAGGQA